MPLISEVLNDTAQPHFPNLPSEFTALTHSFRFDRSEVFLFWKKPVSMLPDQT